jgi:hypothetical protein
MKTVFLITKGDYSDYTILSVCEDRQTAEEIAADHPQSEIEERILNTQQDKRLLWKVSYERLAKERDWYMAHIASNGDVNFISSDKGEIVYPSHPDVKYYVKLYILAETKQDALKKASDIVAQYKYENNLI